MDSPAQGVDGSVDNSPGTVDDRSSSVDEAESSVDTQTTTSSVLGGDATTTCCVFRLTWGCRRRIVRRVADRTETPNTLRTGHVRRSVGGPQDHLGTTDDAWDAQLPPERRDGMEERGR